MTMEVNAANDETIYIYDGNGNLVQKTDADGYVTEYGYDAKNLVEAINYNGGTATAPPLTPTVSTMQSGNDVTITIKDGSVILATKVVAFAKNTTQTYDVGVYTVEVAYNGNGVKSAKITGSIAIPEVDKKGKEVQFAYNKNGELVAMMDWNGTVNFTLDILDRVISVNDQNEKVTGYTYDEVGNKIAVTYPDNTVAAYEFDLLDRMTKLTDAENQNTTYAYDPASQLISMAYPNGWFETYFYDVAGKMTKQRAQDPTRTPSKEILHTYTYDPEGNIINETRSGAGGQEKYDLTHTYDALNRLTRTTGLWGYKERTYEYDSLGNLVYEKNANNTNGAKDGNEYWYNNLNQQILKKVDDKDTYSYTYDNRGNLIKGVYDKKNTIVEQYVYDGANRMVKGTNEKGEESHYIYNGLGNLVANEWIIEKNAYGYTGVDAPASLQVNGVVVCDRHKNSTGQGHINPTGKGHTEGGTTGGVYPKIDNKKFQVVHKDYVLDYTSALRDIIMETESGAGGITYRYTYGLEKASVVMYGIPNGAGSVMQNYNYPNGSENVVKLYYHHDRLGSTDYLTNNIQGKVESYVTYDDWGKPTMKPILKMGVRELDLVTEYTGYMYDQALGIYYAKARMYDAADRRFMAVDPVKGYVTNAQTRAQYTYCLDNPLRYVDPFGMEGTEVGLRAFSEAAGADVGWDEKTRKATVTKDGVTKEYDINDYKVIDGRIQIDPKDLDWLLPKDSKDGFSDTVDRINRMSDDDILDYVRDYGNDVGLSLPPIESLSAGEKAKLANALRQQMIIVAAKIILSDQQSQTGNQNPNPQTGGSGPEKKIADLESRLAELAKKIDSDDVYALLYEMEYIRLYNQLQDLKKKQAAAQTPAPTPTPTTPTPAATNNEQKFNAMNKTLTYVIEAGYTPTSAEWGYIYKYAVAFEGLPRYLKDNVGEVKFLSKDTFKSETGDTNMATAMWTSKYKDPVTGLHPIYINLGKPAEDRKWNNNYVYNYEVNAIHEAAHLWDTAYGVYSDSSEWIAIYNSYTAEQQKAIYPAINNTSQRREELFAAAVARFESDAAYLEKNYKNIYDYIKSIK